VPSETLTAKLQTLPPRPGCYLFKDKQGRVLYVGKATSLRSRVRSYFQESSTDTRMQVPFLLSAVDDVDTIVTGSEKEATILEDSLIKRHKPRFNIKLRDDKSYLSIRIDTAQEYPRVELVRRPSPDGARYFGPHHSATAARRTLNFINKHFRLRTCSDQELRSRKRPCLQYHIKRCPAPCVFEVDRSEYAANVHAVILFLEGRHDEMSRHVQERMQRAARELDYELAAVYRDQLRAIEAVREGQRVFAVKDVDQDVLGLHRDAELCELSVMYVRKGRVVDAISVSMRKVGLPAEEVIGAFIAHHYGENGAAALTIPDELIVPVLPESATGVGEWLSDRRGRKVVLMRPRRGPRAQLLELAMDNARHAFEEKRRASEDIEARLEDIQRKLRLPVPPRVIECVDISHLGGGDTAAGLVCMRDGELDKSGYRSFHVRNVADGDDYAAMREVLMRRFRRALEAEKDETSQEPSGGEDVLEVREPGEEEDAASVRDPWRLPDLLVVDGGRGQLNTALAVARDLGLHDLSVVGLAKERESVAGEVLSDRVYLPGQKNGIAVRPHTPLALLARLRDESHRYANRIRERMGQAARLRSELDDVDGIGPVLRKRLLEHVGSGREVARASDEDLLRVPGITRKHVEALRAKFGAENPGGSSSGPR